MTDTLEKLQAILARDYKIAPERLTPDSLLEEMGVDSLGVAELLFNIEDEFAVTVPPEPVTLATLGDVVRYIDGLIHAQGSDEAQAEGAATAPA